MKNNLIEIIHNDNERRLKHAIHCLNVGLDEEHLDPIRGYMYDALRHLEGIDLKGSGTCRQSPEANA